MTPEQALTHLVAEARLTSCWIKQKFVSLQGSSREEVVLLPLSRTLHDLARESVLLVFGTSRVTQTKLAYSGEGGTCNVPSDRPKQSERYSLS